MTCVLSHKSLSDEGRTSGLASIWPLRNPGALLSVAPHALQNIQDIFQVAGWGGGGGGGRGGAGRGGAGQHDTL